MTPHPPPAPSPFDGLVHVLTEVECRMGGRYMKVGCGAKMPVYLRHETLGGATCWASEVTCPPCAARVGLVVTP